MEEKESKNSVKVTYKMSSSSGKIGYDLSVECANADIKEMEELSNLALKTAKALRDRI